MRRFTKKIILLALAVVLLTFTCFIFDNTFAPPIIEWIKRSLHTDEIYLYITKISIQMFSISLGIIMGLFIDKWRKYNDLMINLEKILPLVEFELRVNYRVLYSNPPAIVLKSDLQSDSWNIYKTEVSKWANINVVTMKEIYGLIDEWDKSYVKKERIVQDIDYIINEWMNWYENKSEKTAKKSRTDAIKIFEKLDLDNNQRLALEDMKNSKRYSDTTNSIRCSVKTRDE